WLLARVQGKQQAELRGKEYLLSSIIIATIPGAIFGLLLDKYAEEAFRSPLLIAVMLSVLGVLLYVADTKLPQAKELASISWRDALLIGIAQSCALIPGVSRSGATITMGRFLSFDRMAAARFSFLLS